MKKFEQWFDNCIWGSDNPQVDEKPATRGAWRAAFECILNEMTVDKFKDNGELRTFIENELEE